MGNSKSKMLKLIDAFLKGKRTSVSGDYAPVEDGDVAALSALLSALIEGKWEADADGDRPIRFTLTDCTRYENQHFFQLRQLFRITNFDVGALDEYIELAASNAKQSMDRLECALKLKRMGRGEKTAQEK